MLQSRNPATGELLASYEVLTASQLEAAVGIADRAYRTWRQTALEERLRLVGSLGAYLQQHRQRLALLITLEMGKPIRQAEAEIDKCANACTFYAEHGAAFLEPRDVNVDGARAHVQFDPIGVVLAIMPWNYPFWQLIRPGLAAVLCGNTILLKHAPNVPQCAMAIERAFVESGFPPHILTTLLIDTDPVERLLSDRRIQAVTLTGSDKAGSSVGSLAGRNLKRSVLELGGSDPFIVLADADLELAARLAVRARTQNAGQSCIAAKRFLIATEVFDAFLERFAAHMRELKVGDPQDPTTDVGPMAREDLRATLEGQVQRSIELGARVITGGGRLQGSGFFFQPTILTDLEQTAPVCCEETFGPVAAVIRTRDAAHAVEIANASEYGLGATLCTRDLQNAELLTQHIDAGMVFVNAMVASDPRLPFGGVKRSGYGRELGEFGVGEFANVKTVWMQE
jgi:succinate-semialdehyde dehydrogenase/glutarate-semialdehyde dehydrogenase